MKAAAWLASALVIVTFVPMLAIAAVAAAAVPPITPCTTAAPPISGSPGPTSAPIGEQCPQPGSDSPSIPPIDDSIVWADGSDCGFEGVENPNSCQQALNEAARIAASHPCDNEVRGGTWLHRCLEFVGRVYGYRAAGTPTALQHYNLLKGRGLVHTSDKIPTGALVFFTTGKPEGHVAIYAGGAAAFSNDYLRRGCINLTPMSTMDGGGRYLGWAPPVFPNGVPT